MGFRRFRRGGFRRRRAKTHWMQGIQLNWNEVFFMAPILDPTGLVLGYTHAVQLTGDVDLFEGGGEGMLVKRIVGMMRPIITLNPAEGDGILPLDGAKVISSIQQLMVPEGTSVANVPQLVAQNVLSQQGLSSENILWSRMHEQPAYPTNTATQDWETLTYTFNITTVGANQVFYQPYQAGIMQARFWDIDCTSVRKIEENTHLFLMTHTHSLLQGPGQFAGGLAPRIRYTGYLRQLIQKAG